MPATIELAIRHLADASITAELRAYGRSTNTVLAPPQAITISTAALLALSDSPDDYGAVLTNRVFPAPLREGWGKAKGQAESAGSGVHMRILIDDPSGALHAIRWELLRDPLDTTPLAKQEGGSLARLVPSDSLHDPAPPAKPQLRALVAVAGPSDLATYKLTPFNVVGEAARAQAALGAITAEVLAESPHLATLENIKDRLRNEPQLLYLVCHGQQTPQGTTLYLVGDNGKAAPITGEKLKDEIAALDKDYCPLLAVLVACEGGSQEDAPLAAVGPLLARAGVPAVIAMQAKISMAAAARLTTRLLRELDRDGRIDRALAAARAELGEEWWVPALWLRSRDGRLWEDGQAERPARPPVYDSAPTFAEQGIFVGRERLLDQVRESLTAHPTARVALVGLPGGGKSRIARALFHDPDLRKHFQGGILCAALGENPSLELEIARWFGEVFRGADAQQLTIEKQAEQLRQHIAADARPWLCILDDLWAAQDLTTFQALLGTPTLLITTRQQDVIDQLGDAIRPQEEIFPVGKLKRAASIDLLRQRAGITTAEYDAELADLATLAGDLPLALTIVGGFLRSRNTRQAWLQEALQDLASVGGHESIDQAAQNYGRRRSWWQRLMGIDPVESGLDVDAIIQLSYKLLPREAQRAIIQLAALPPDPLSFDDLAAGVVIDARGEPLRERLLALTERSLVQVLIDDERMQIHRRLWEWARRQSPHELEQASARWRSWRLGPAPDTKEERAAWMQNRRNAELLLQAWREACGEAGASEAERRRSFDANELRAAVFTAIPTLIQFYYGSIIAASLEQAARFFERRGDQKAAGAAYLYCGQIAHQQANMAKAHAYGNRALGLYQAAGDQQSQAAALSLLGNIAYNEGHYSEAEPLLRQALAIDERIFGVNDPSTAASLNNLAELLRVQGDYTAARPLFNRALAIREQTLGPSHPDTAISLNNLAALLRAEGDYATARPLFNRALAICEQTLGPSHPDTAASLNNLAALLRAEGDYATARPLFNRALAIREQTLGPSHPDTAASLNNLAELLEAQGDYTAARSLYERAFAIHEQTLGLSHPITRIVKSFLERLPFELDRTTDNLE